jgi:hypothetical protein
MRPCRPRNRLLNPIRVMTALREAEGNVTAVDAIAHQIMRDKGLDEPAGRMFEALSVSR